TTDLANYNGNYTYGLGPKGKFRKKTTVVGKFLPNNFGLYDMHWVYMLPACLLKVMIYQSIPTIQKFNWMKNYVMKN
ncbi:hypothetical protein QUF74_13655, partial [Candidatus Halobeggiatoa sp. HSG11]|nr:hypothetical protein [Candidatus Halobeggiatoa sp. HSG11]